MNTQDIFILSSFQTRPLMELYESGQRRCLLSLDLGRSEIKVALNEQGVILPNGWTLAWADIATINKREQSCFRVTAQGLEKVQAYSEAFPRAYSLMPTSGAPTLLISGIPMHRIKETEPLADSRSKIEAVAPQGQVLDTATGLGYTALLAARQAEHVITIELDPTVLEIARLNPWSRALFSSPNIEQRLGDAFDLLPEFPDRSFDRIIHDPPMLSLAGTLYSTEFYRQLLRVLSPRGRLFHYIGDPNSKSGRSATAGVIRRLQEAGFRRVQRAPQAFGVIAWP